MTREVKLMRAEICIVDEGGYVVRQVTDNRTGEQNHTDNNDGKAYYYKGKPRRTDVTDNLGNVTRVEHHHNGVVRGLPESHLLRSADGKQRDNKRRYYDESKVKEQYCCQDHAARL